MFIKLKPATRDRVSLGNSRLTSKSDFPEFYKGKNFDDDQAFPRKTLVQGRKPRLSSNTTERWELASLTSEVAGLLTGVEERVSWRIRHTRLTRNTYPGVDVLVAALDDSSIQENEEIGPFRDLHGLCTTLQQVYTLAGSSHFASQEGSMDHPNR